MIEFSEIKVVFVFLIFLLKHYNSNAHIFSITNNFTQKRKLGDRQLESLEEIANNRSQNLDFNINQGN